MKVNWLIRIGMLCFLCLCGALFADWMRMDPPPDVDKSTHGHVGTGTCWQATAANMLAGAGYGEGATVQERAVEINSVKA